MDNAIKTIFVAVVSIINLWLVFLLITGLNSQSAQWDLEVFMWLWRLGIPALLASFIILIISAAQKMNRGWLNIWMVNLLIPIAIFGILLKS